VKRLDREEGASAVEFAIIASLLLLILFGIIQFGIAYNRVQGLASAGREGARTASVGAPESDVADRVRAAQSLFTPADVKVIIDYSTNNGQTFGNTICDDTGGTPCNSTDNLNTPCAQAGVGSLVRVRARVPASPKYAIAIPLWANWELTYTGTGVYRCETTS
jgi:Flp pilus assembly protein TadG